MKYTCLPHTDLNVSTICLGTMTFGEQNTKEEAHQLLDYAISCGINFIDTAEMYPIAAREETFGETERYIGRWLKKRGGRDDLIIATKIAGPNRGMEYIRSPLDFSPKSISDAIELSLKNLQTDYIDLYQLHWPERKMNMFGQRGFTIVDDGWSDNFKSILETLQDFIQAGKIRYIGVSNESAWGLMHFLKESEQYQLPRMVTIQNPYSLLNRLSEVGLTEICYREKVGFLAYSPLGFGILTGKYLQGKLPGSRIDLFPQFTRYTSENATRATALYHELADQNGLTLTQMALAFVQQQSFVSSTIIGATNIKQLKENIETHSITLSPQILLNINNIQELIPNPAP